MSQENIELVLRQAQAANRRDPEAFVSFLRDDVEWEEDPSGFPGLRRVYRGREEVREWFREVVLELWEDFDFRHDEIAAAPGDRVFIGGVLRTSGQGSGAETRQRFWQVISLRSGLIARRQVFVEDRAAALLAAQLPG
jgi:ketosteroid isomerase-like protein